jgi:hypothetical protein
MTHTLDSKGQTLPRRSCPSAGEAQTAHRSAPWRQQGEWERKLAQKKTKQKKKQKQKKQKKNGTDFSDWEMQEKINQKNHAGPPAA